MAGLVFFFQDLVLPLGGAPGQLDADPSLSVALDALESLKSILSILDLMLIRYLHQDFALTSHLDLGATSIIPPLGEICLWWCPGGPGGPKGDDGSNPGGRKAPPAPS